MATGDDAATAGMDLVAGTDDWRDGWDEINKSRDYIATQPVHASRISSGTLFGSVIPNLPASKITSGTLFGSVIPNLPASQITSGTFSGSLIPTLPASKITSGTLSGSLIPNLPASKITSGTFLAARIPGGPFVSGNANNPVIRDSVGSFHVPDPTDAEDVANKRYVDNAGGLANGPTNTAYNRGATGSNRYAVWMNDANQFMRNTSSKRYKKSIKPLDDCLDNVLALRPVTYEARDKSVAGRHIGLIAEEVAVVYPQVVPLEDGKPEAVNYEFLVAPLIGAVQELTALVDQLHDRIAALEAK